jgi:hypothetical protein
MLKMPLQTHCNNFLVNVSSHHIIFHHSSESFTLYFYNFCKFPSLIEIVYYCISVFVVLSLINICYIIGYSI